MGTIPTAAPPAQGVLVSRVAPLLAAGLIGLALVAPATLLGSFVRDTIASDIAVWSAASEG